jgi:predicted nucleotide-binding protein (sugar kinase/HSP70/actin superfamily)
MKISEKYDIPILSLSIDEHTAEAGFITRVEAFLDMLRMRKKRR